jgi:hypothetical protein
MCESSPIAFRQAATRCGRYQFAGSFAEFQWISGGEVRGQSLALARVISGALKRAGTDSNATANTPAWKAGGRYKFKCDAQAKSKAPSGSRPLQNHGQSQSQNLRAGLIVVNRCACGARLGSWIRGLRVFGSRRRGTRLWRAWGRQHDCAVDRSIDIRRRRLWRPVWPDGNLGWHPQGRQLWSGRRRCK